ncbi:MAG: RNA-binding S4 domain-containing protein [Coprobacillus sp.]|nr:RNA-binding S4 domain-containing protein [Coprobacillus sp.]
MVNFDIREGDEYIELQNLLKLIGVISTGGEAKVYLSMNNVLVNSQRETRRGRKLYPDDIVRIGNKEYLIKKT